MQVFDRELTTDEIIRFVRDFAAQTRRHKDCHDCLYIDMALELANEVENNRRAAPENKPLTLGQLREMKGQPVYCIGQTRFDVHFDGWKVVAKNNLTANVIRFTDGMDFPVEVYGERLLAYARKPEGSAP